MAYDEARGRVILYGGSTPLDGGARFEFFDDTWAFDGSDWTQLSVSAPRQSGMRLVWHARARSLMAFGGFDGSLSLSHLLRLDSTAWTPLASRPQEPAAEPGVVYDSRRDRLIAFGGSEGRSEVNDDTWEFDGTRWTRFEGAGPGARQGFTMEYDAARGVTVLFGGMTGDGRRLADTWEFDGTQWRSIPVSGPSARFAHGSAYDARRGMVIVFGGIAGENIGETWGWNGTVWRLLATDGPSPRSMPAMAYDRARDRVVLFGGRTTYPDGDMNDTWEWDGTRWQQVGPRRLP